MSLEDSIIKTYIAGTSEEIRNFGSKNTYAFYSNHNKFELLMAAEVVLGYASTYLPDNIENFALYPIILDMAIRGAQGLSSMVKEKRMTHYVFEHSGIVGMVRQIMKKENQTT